MNKASQNRSNQIRKNEALCHPKKLQRDADRQQEPKGDTWLRQG
jgi:hypothetical protein